MTTKFIKYILIIKLIIAFVCALGINMLMFDRMSVFPEETFNKFGYKLYQYGDKIDEYVKFLPDEVYELYGAYTGINRGSAFFAPNVGAIEFDFILTSNDKPIPPIYESPEGASRMYTFTQFLNKKFREDDKEKRQEILEILGQIVFLKYDDIDQLDAKVKVQKYPLIHEVEENEVKSLEYDIFTIRRL